MAEAFRIGKLTRSEGAYRKGLAVTTDPGQRWDPATGRGSVFVDVGRFEAWLAAGVLTEDAATVTELLPAPPARTDEAPAATTEDVTPTAPMAREEA